MTQPYITVSTLTKYIKRKFDVDPYMQKVWIKGEISNFTHHQRNHLYFTLKDENARISAVMFGRDAGSLQFTPENGMKVLVEGSISVFEKTGAYQIYIQRMEEDGVGNLFLAFQKMKQKLEKEGLFDVARKRPIPKFPSHIGVVTSPTGAAIQDIIITLRRRYPLAKVTLFPAIVQGEYAAPSVVKGIQNAQALGVIDVLIVGRGGGSIEELWAFNEEIVARAIANCTIPVISAVGHETDTTIADFVADLRAPTPTGAAEMATPNIMDLKERISNASLRLEGITKRRIEDLRMKVNRYEQSYVLKNPRQLYVQKEQQLDYLLGQLHGLQKALLHRKELQFTRINQRLDIRYLQKGIEKHRMEVNHHTKQINALLNHVKLQKESRFVAITNKLDALSPLKIMERGYSIVESNKQIVTSINNVAKDDQIQVQLQDGNLQCTVNSIVKREASS